MSAPTYHLTVSRLDRDIGFVGLDHDALEIVAQALESRLRMPDGRLAQEGDFAGPYRLLNLLSDVIVGRYP